MNFLTKSISIEIENFISYLKQVTDMISMKPFTKSAFVQYRKKLKPSAFKALSDLLIQEFYTDNDEAISLWNGLRLLSVDGSSITLPNTKELMSIYGQAKNQTKSSIVQARASVLYDVLNHYVLDGSLSPLAIGERALALKHLSFCKPTDLIIYDRGYPSFDFIYQHHKKNLPFLMRVKESFSKVTKAFLVSGKLSEKVQIHPGKNAAKTSNDYNENTTLTVRLIRIELPSGETELLITSLLDGKRYNHKIFKQLYFQRWKVETFYDELKNKLKVEYFSGYSNQSILQDFNAALLISNIQTLIVSELKDEISKKNSDRKYEYKVNKSLSYGFMKNRVLELFLSNTSIEETTKELKSLFKRHLIPIRPNRTNLRNVGKYRKRTKPKITKNNKDAF